MNAAHHDNVDRLLHEAGARWRAGEPPAPAPDLSRFADSHAAVAGRSGWVRRWAPVAAMAGVAAVIAALAVPLALPDRNAPEEDLAADPGAATAAATPTPWATLPADTGSGVRVAGRGFLVQRDGTTRFCADLAPILLLNEAPAECGPLAVVATGVERRWLTASPRTGGTAHQPRWVEGLYRAGTLAVDLVAPAAPDLGPAVAEAPVPCQPPAGGWPLGNGLPELDTDSANRLIEAVRGDPRRFADLWEGHPDGVGGGESLMPTRMVMVVGTTGDVKAAQRELAAIYSGNLCVHRVRHSARDLEQIVERINASSVPAEASVQVVHNKVGVMTVVLDPPTVAVLDEFGPDVLMVQPLLTPLG